MLDWNDKSWLNFNKPHEPVTKDIIARWIKTVLGKTGIDLSCYIAHTTRAASISAASSANPIKIIRKATGVFQCEYFPEFYNKPLVNSPKCGEQLTIIDWTRGKQYHLWTRRTQSISILLYTECRKRKKLPQIIEIYKINQTF